MKPVVAILGRPNVGKSTLFNRLVGSRRALGAPTPGVTRDRREGEARIGQLEFTAVDTAGLEEAPATELLGAMQEQARCAALSADVVLLVVDAAYAEYVGRNDYADGRELVEAGGNTVMTRTFSKIYGLAALRLGWAYCPPNVVGVLQRVRGPFNVNAAAQAAGVAAIRDAGHVEFSRMHNDKWLPWLTDEVRALGFEVLPSVGNFILIRFPDVEAALAALQDQGVIPRRVAGYGFPDGLRITVGREEDNRAVVAALRTLVS